MLGIYNSDEIIEHVITWPKNIFWCLTLMRETHDQRMGMHGQIVY